MSIGGTMRTSVSGMNAQATRLSVVSENIANADTTGYKRSEAEFSSFTLPQNKGGFNSGSVEAQVRRFISEQGGVNYTGNATNAKKIDLMVQGNGMFVVGDGSGGNFLTRAGSFTQVPNGTLVNAAGYTLMGYPVGQSGTDFTLNGYTGLQPVNLDAALLNANPTTKGKLTVNLNKDADAVATAGIRPSANPASTGSPAAAPTKFTSSSSMVVYDNAGKAITLDVYYTKTAANTWEMTVFNSADRAVANPTTDPKYSSTAPFPYGTAAGGTTPVLATKTLTFDGATFKLPADSAIDIAVPGGKSVKLDLSNTTQFSSKYEPLKATVDGNPAEVIDSISTGADGTITATFTSGTTRALFKVPLALVNSPDNLTPVSGNAYSVGVESGSILMGFGGSGGFGKIVAGALENSNVDMASELTDMIGAQRSYTANSKVFQTGSEILDVLVNLKR